MPLIILNGPPGSGKTTFAEALVTRGARRLQLGIPFREFVRNSLGLTPRDMEEFKDVPMPGHRAPLRDALIAAANSVEMVDPDVWVKQALSSYAMYHQGQIMVLDAVGKISQAIWLYENQKRLQIDSIHLVRISRDGRWEFTFSDGRQMVPDPPFGTVTRIVNDSTISALHRWAEDVMRLYV